MSLTVYQYPNCSTCRKALKWLDANGVDYTSVDITAKPPAKTKLKKAWKDSGHALRRFFNTSGQSYRQGGFKEKLATMSDGEAIDALAADGKLIKRPLAIGESAKGEGVVLVGFKEDEWKRALL